MKQFLHAIHGKSIAAGLGFMINKFVDDKCAGRFFKDIDQAVGYVEKNSTTDLYVSCGAFKKRPARRGTAAEVAAIGALWADVDVGKPNTPATQEDALRLLAELDHPASIVVDSGSRGLHPWWVLDEPVTDKKLAQSICTEWDGKVRSTATAMGWSGLDNVSSIAWMMRIPGTVNTKETLPRPVELLELHEERTYTAETFHQNGTVIETGGGDLQLDRRYDVDDQASALELLKDIDPDAGGYDPWLEVLCAIRTVFGPVEGLRVAIEWSGRGGKFKENEINGKWDGLPTTYNFGTLMHHAGKGRPLPACDREVESRRQTDDGSSKMFVARFGHEVIWVKRAGAFFIYDKGRWISDDETMRVEELAKSIGREVQTLAARRNDKDLFAWGAKLLNQNRLAALLKFAKSKLATPIGRLDADPWLLNVRNGTVDLKNGTYRPHSPADMLTNMAEADYDEDAKCPMWLEFLDQIHSGDQDTIEFMQEWYGYCLTGDPDIACFPILFGDGENGKSKQQEVIRKIMGSYAMAAQQGFFDANKNEHPTVEAQLWGKRLVTAAETEKGVNLNTELIKRQTGEDSIRARFMKENFFEFPRTNKFTLMVNHKPLIKDNSHATWRRLRVVPYQFVPPVRELKIVNRLLKERNGILRWMLQGLRRLQDRDLELTYPDAIREATEDMRRTADPIGAELSKLMTPTTGSNTPVELVVEHFQTEHGALAFPRQLILAAARAMMGAPQKRKGPTQPDGSRESRAVYVGWGIR